MDDEYIRKQDAVHTIMGQPPDAHYPSWYAAQIEAIPAADVVPVVRCKDCHCHGTCTHEQYLGLDGFCSHGERREEQNA